ncbi:trifunctional transcriptional regulator/proline dehydrogenase/L-glutamate gamma-semialdehyde dehydrogenase [Sandaracinobacter sp. RS1-74]|uniref:trifunctional transcriptional regulator/proline dehydrogenase/L-glutamate gamma-semialdehyde dehydrogenase n=1 Tax=Sandaracinobacteroides sayramensis TaxID=2913411 RepID=UPI001EDA64CE|nr:trifunctional transcriptional regulator/proline dehydrogenase/L-glutamate gamma-semialdehyde dehydrogenase [Sandaracinobacteroides sayramensis]MCG2841531.1 trifunctional transcriptional regulator/proline dehydrogenase/L-glutamate gamma-semialdehyde dehydrogenase [Sandaracinobacteroides sayramensis]
MTSAFSFSRFAPPVAAPTPLRQAITAAYRRPEAECMAPLIEAATLPPESRKAIAATARKLVEQLRRDGQVSGVAALVQEFSLSSREGVALMCLAEALLRVPDSATRDALIRDKVAPGDWKAHVGGDRSLFVNAATWGLIVTGRLTSSVNENGLGAALTRVIARGGEPVIRKGVELAMRMMGEQFVTGETIDEALARARELEARGFGYSYDMLGEAAMTAADADRYNRDYENAIHAIGKASAGRGVHGGPGISIKLSALHPRYARAKAERVMAELLPRVKALCLLAKQHDIGLNIDAEEADRLELSLDLLEALALDADLAGWQGLGFVVQAYGKRCPFVLDYLTDLAKRADRRIMVRLVKGAYWDAEIKRAQVDGLPGFPVYTRKLHTDIAYVACARKLLAARTHIFPQFATHNAQTLATVHHLAGPDFQMGDYEFQCLHGMGEPLYSQVVGAENLNRPCRIYAPVGTHETLLAYLVRRLLENGANSSFVNRIADEEVPVAELIADPVDLARALPNPGAPHEQIALPRDLYTGRRNSLGLDLSDEGVLEKIGAALEASTLESRTAGNPANPSRPVLNPADHRDRVGLVHEHSPESARAAVAVAAASGWADIPAAERAQRLERAADLMESRTLDLLGLIMREAGKSLPNAIGEVREAVDFLRYYAAEGRQKLTAAHKPIGPVAAISPWNFPLAIFTGQVSAALMAGNAVLAKPAEETPLIAAEAVAILHQAGVPADALQLVAGDGRIGAALAGAPDTAGVLFTGSTEVARLIQSQLAERAQGRAIPLIAETGGQNAMIVDTSALTEQVVADVIASAFDSAGQRCSALRLLCLQEEAADRTLTMLKGALAELSVGPTDRLSRDIGPVITADARDGIEAHIGRMAQSGAAITRLPLGADCANGTFVAPTIVEIADIRQLQREVFGPVLHVLRYRREKLGELIEAINGTGYGLTFGLQTRLDETIEEVTSRVHAGNHYVNRNIIGAVVGVQPFGGRGLSGTGPKAGGPLYLGRLVSGPAFTLRGTRIADPALTDLVGWLEAEGEAGAIRRYAEASAFGAEQLLAGPVGEDNHYRIEPRGPILLRPTTRSGFLDQLAATLATGNDAVAELPADLRPLLRQLPKSVTARIRDDAPELAGALVEGNAEQVRAALTELAARPGPLILAQTASPGETGSYRVDWLVHEVSTSINTTASGGNATLMAIA